MSDNEERRGHQLVMLLKAVDLLCTPGGVTKSTMAEELSIHKRSVDRLLAVLEDLRFPLVTVGKASNGEKLWAFLPEYVMKLPNIHVPDLRLSLSEIMALYLVRGESQVFRGTEIEKKIDAAFHKLGWFMPEGFSEQLAKIQKLFLPTGKFKKDYSGKETIIDGLREAMLQQKECFIQYHAFRDDKKKRYYIHPLHFFEDYGGLYIIANIPEYGQVRTLAVERILELDLTAMPFTYPSDFDPQEYISSTFGIIRDQEVHVEIWFSGEVARYIRERTWAPGQKLSENDGDGSVILEMTTSGWLDVKRWVLSYGPHAKLLGPPELREEIARELKCAADCYL